MNEASMPTETSYHDDEGGFPEPTPVPTSALSAALAKAQGEFAPVVRDKTVSVTMRSGGKYTFSYAPLESILHAVKPALSKNGLSITQAMVTHHGKEYVETTLRHSSGESICNRIPLFVKDEGPQAYGSALTYARRYGVTLLLCVSADDDDDGNAAEGNSAETTRSRAPAEDDMAAKLAKASTSAKLLASSFKAALKVGDKKVSEVHESANKEQDLYNEAWGLLDARERREIKAAIERVRVPNTNRPAREPAEA